jgi:hypothetical protein
MGTSTTNAHRYVSLPYCYLVHASKTFTRSDNLSESMIELDLKLLATNAGSTYYTAVESGLREQGSCIQRSIEHELQPVSHTQRIRWLSSEFLSFVY